MKNTTVGVNSRGPLLLAGLQAASMLRLLLVVWVGCASPRGQSPASDPAGVGHEALALSMPDDLETVTRRGPYAVRVTVNVPVTLRAKEQEQVFCDLFEPIGKSKSPVLLISHGNRSSKQSHFEQARHIASWGFAVVTVSLPNFGEWIENGGRLLRLARILAGTPWVFSDQIDPGKLVLAGHSFGGSAVALAMAAGAPALGALLLDPALYSQSVVPRLNRITKPMFLLGADRKVFRSRHRGTFFKEARGPMYEVSIRDAHHDDAQNPSIRQVANVFSFDPMTSEPRQRLFSSAMVLASWSLAESGGFERAWQVFRRSARLKQELIAHRSKTPSRLVMGGRPAGR